MYCDNGHCGYVSLLASLGGKINDTCKRGSSFIQKYGVWNSNSSKAFKQT